MLAVRVPPAALVTVGAIGIAQVLIIVSGTELHRLVIGGHGITGVSLVAMELDTVAVILVINGKSVVLGPPILAIDVPQVNAQHRRVLFGQLMQMVVAEPEFTVNTTESCINTQTLCNYSVPISLFDAISFSTKYRA